MLLSIIIHKPKPKPCLRFSLPIEFDFVLLNRSMAENLSNTSLSQFMFDEFNLDDPDFLNLHCRQCNATLPLQISTVCLRYTVYEDYLNSSDSLCARCIIDNVFSSTSNSATILDLINYLNHGQVGNTGDYVIEADAEFQTLLQNLLERELATYGGAPPASNLSLANLENFVIDTEEACTICQEIVNGGEVVKKLPCKHVYHDHCITTWLQSRNSCPVCRFELPTDDEEYENRRKRRKLE